MRLTSESTGKFMVLANLDKSLSVQPPIYGRIKALVEGLISDTRLFSIEEAINKHILDYFYLRIDLIKWQYKNQFSINEHMEIINQQIAKNMQLNDLSYLAKTSTDALITIEKILASAKAIEFEYEETVTSMKFLEEPNLKPNYESFQIIAEHPNPKFKFLKKFIDESLKIDLAIILSDLILTNYIKNFSPHKIEELSQYIIDTITRYGAYGMFTGFWIPDPEDNSFLINRIEILESKLQLDYYKHPAITAQDFSKMLLS